jgi:hypothetical protein
LKEKHLGGNSGAVKGDKDSGMRCEINTSRKIFLRREVGTTAGGIIPSYKNLNLIAFDHWLLAPPSLGTIRCPARMHGQRPPRAIGPKITTSGSERIHPRMHDEFSSGFPVGCQ